MEASSPDGESRGATRRRSGRVRKSNALVTSSPSKRKRGELEDDDVDMEDASEDDSEAPDEGEPDEEEVKERKRRAKKPKTSKPAPKKTKSGMNGQAVRSLAIRPATGTAKGKKKGKAQQNAAAGASGGLHGLYAMYPTMNDTLTRLTADVFTHGKGSDDVAAEWLLRFKQHESDAVADLFNFVLKSAGCDHTIMSDDVEDPDHFTDKLAEIQEEYQAQGITEYPLIAKAKSSHAFRQSFTGLLEAMVQVLATSNIIFDDDTVMEVISAWIGSMSSAGSRPFRHTATVAALAIMNALCVVAKEVVGMSAKTQRQAEGEKKGKRANKGRVKELEGQVKQFTQNREKLENLMTTWFDTVFVHRYRDVDPRIRVDCAQALGEWCTTYPDLFFEGQYLRYLGWVLSDTNAATRHEVVKALIKLYKDDEKQSGLRQFTERFRPRIVEMATRDHDHGVRADAVTLLELLRDAGFLEPDDVDSIGRLIFDSELKVRKAVVQFFVANVNDIYETKVDEVGGQEGLEEVLDSLGGSDDFDIPRIEWLRFKCLAELLQTYDALDQTEPSNMSEVPLTDSYLLVAGGMESRFSLAADVLYDNLTILENWEALAGYLLFDHSQTADQNGATTDVETQFMQQCKLNEEEEILLLEILNTAVKRGLTQTVQASSDAKAKKSSKRQREEVEQQQEQAARHLTQLIPQLLKKFGANPQAATAVLRLGQVLNLEVFEELRQDVTALSALLEDVKKQFVAHGEAKVVEEASRALLHAMAFEDLGEVTGEKLQSLWEHEVHALNKLAKDPNLASRGNLQDDVLSALSNTILRIRSLCKTSDPSEHLEAKPSTSSRSKRTAAAEPAIASIISIVDRGVPRPNLDDETNKIEDILVLNACEIINFYFMWKVQHFRTLVSSSGTVPETQLEPVIEYRDRFLDGVTNVLRTRFGADDLRISLANTYLDVFVTFSTLVHARPGHNAASQAQKRAQRGASSNRYLSLSQEVPRRNQGLLVQILAAAEKAFAKRTKHKLEEEDVDGDPVDPDEDPKSDNEDEDEAMTDADRASRLAQTLLAEQKLCALGGRMVLGLWAGVLDGKNEGARDEDGTPLVEMRLKRNHKRLGPNFKAVIDQFEANKPGAQKRKAAAAAKAKNAQDARAKDAEKQKKSEALVLDDDIEDDEMDGREDRRRRDNEDIDAEEEERAAREAEENGDDGEQDEDEVESVVGD